MKQCVLFVVVGIFLSVSTLAQSFKQPDIIPPSPEAASLGKYAEIPVNYNSGIPQVGVPLYTINVNDMEFPISLSYHAGGNRVDEMASWVGLGWSLTANGVITRVMRGRPDESSFGFFNKTQWDTWQLMKSWSLPPPQIGSTPEAWQKHNFQLAVARGEKDLMPDVFSFNFGGYSGTLYFDVDKNPVIVPYQDLKISHPFNAGGNQWIITTPEGIEYVFNNTDAELTTPLGESGSGSPAYYSTWNLSEIRSLKQPGFIRFYYTAQSLAGIETTPNAGVVLAKFGGNPNQPCTMDPPYPQGMGSSEYSINAKYLSQIQYTNGTITFTSTNDREDKYQNVTYNGRKLNTITVTSGVNTKTFQFTYSYFGSGSSKRLKLLKVQEGTKGPYQFEYYGPDLPDQTSLSQDLWGFYNGADNSTLLPALTPSQQNAFVGSGQVGADRSSSFNNAVAATLSKITYPTLGYTRLEYEGNSVYTNHTTYSSSSATALGATTNPNMNIYENALKQYYQTQQYAYLGGPINIKSASFTLTSESTIPLTTVKSISGPGSIGMIAETYLVKTPIDFGNPICYDCNGEYPLQPGEYIILSAASQSGVSVTLSASWPVTSMQNVEVGGIRIKSIEQNDGITTRTKRFSYTQGFNQSTGQVFDWPVLTKTTPCGNLYVSANNVSGLAPSGGSHIGYKRVVVTDENGVNGQTVYTFNNNLNPMYRNLLIRESHLRFGGDSVKDVRYNYNFETCNSNSPCIFSSYAAGFEISIKKHILVTSGQYTSTDHFEFDVNERQYPTLYPYQTRIREKNFSMENYPSSLLTTKTIAAGYNAGSYYESHTLPTEIITTLPTGEKIIDKFVNSPETEAPLQIKVPVIQHTLIERNGQKYLKSSVFNSYVNNLLTSVSAYEAASLVPYTEGMSLSYVPRLEQTFNVSKKLLERFSPGGPKTGYIWDSNNMLPIAEVHNSGSRPIAFTSFENSASEGNWTFTLSPSSTAKTGFKSYSFVSGQNISRTLLTSTASYKVSYWAKNGIPTVSNVTASNDAAAADAQGWKYYEKTISGTTTVTISAAAGTLIDELRLYPIDAKMRSFTYKTLNGLATVNDENNQMSFYFYDTNGNLETIKDYNGNILQHYVYKYKN